MPVETKQYRFLPPETLDALRNVELVARQLVEGTITGLHRSPYHGFSSEFAEYRKYCPGDATRYVDWVVYAKTDRYYVKQFEEETNTRAYIMLDTSGSMRLGHGKIHKFNYACYLAAAFMYLFQHQRDAVGLFTYADRILDYFPAKSSRRHFLALLSHLENLAPAGQSAAANCFHKAAEEVHRRSIVLVFSDLFDVDPEFVRALQHFRYKQCEVILFQILDPLETEFPYRGLIDFRDLETDERIEVEAEDFRHLYLRDLQAYTRQLKQTCNRMGIAVEPVSTGRDFDRALTAYFYKREKMF